MWVRLIMDWGGMGRGSILYVTQKQGGLLIDTGIASETTDPELAAPKFEQAIQSKKECRTK